MADDTNAGAAGQPMDWTAEEKYWQENHASQEHATDETTYDHFAPAYRVGAEAVSKYPDKDFAEIEEDIALDYEKHRAGDALPWDRARGASKAAWSKVSGLNSPRDPTRGMRGGI